jgi:hypothetical protein
MGIIEKAIKEFQNECLVVYSAAPNRIVRDARGADRAIKDHIGRWLFEILQNSDDADASEVCILLKNRTIYVADNGHGLKPNAVSAISGTDFSDKASGTIGRKGVGFKSVYELSYNPQVLTIGGEGIEFSKEKTRDWLRTNKIDARKLPYQWVPFCILWDDAVDKDPNLDMLRSYRTVVRLPIAPNVQEDDIQQLFNKWPPHTLFAFRHVKRIRTPGFEIILTRRDDRWLMRDTRGNTPAEWQVKSHLHRPPDEILQTLGEDDRNFITSDGVGFLIAAPLEDDCVVPAEDYLPIHVFYPTEQRGPVRLLLHAEFLVKSDRTAIISIESSPFNAWVAEKLAGHICDFVNDSYKLVDPSRHTTLLVPSDDRESHPVAKTLWERIVDKAKAELKLADIEAQQRLVVSEAVLICVSVRTDLARTLLETTTVRGRLLHPSFDNDKEARKALKELGCKEIHDQDLMATIAENADSLATDTQWVWTCWQWLADWVAKEPYGEEHRKRIERVKLLPVVPINDSVVKASDLSDHIVTWKPDVSVGDLPDWLPLSFVEDWFSDRIQNEDEQESSVRKLSKKLGIAEPGADVIQRAVGRAIEQYWKNKQGDPGRFLRFILEQDWHETADASPSLRRCPVPLSQSVRDEQWAEAANAYFGHEWGNDLLAMLYDGVAGIEWVGSDVYSPINNDNRRCVLEWLGVADCPRVFTAHSYDAVEAEKLRVSPLVNYNYVLKAEALYLDRVVITSLSPGKSKLLLTILCHNWESYYKSKSTIPVEHTPRSRTYFDHVPAAWWYNLLSECIPPILSNGTAPHPLKHCWLPDKRTIRTIGDLLPVIDIDAFGVDKDAVRDWLIKEGEIRTRIDQVNVKEWKTLLSIQIPEKVVAKRLMLEERLRDKVTGWYMACLETMADRENVSENAFALCPLLCRKANDWQYVVNEPRYLNDDSDLGTAFAEDVWLFHIPARLSADAVKYFGIIPLSQSVEVNVTPEQPQSPLLGELNVRFRESLPYVWAWRSSQSKQAGDKLSVRLKGLEVYVVPTLKASLSLGSLHHEVERRWHVDDEKFYLRNDHANETELAQALANALDVRSEADFYENLLHCNDDLQRREKLLSKGIAEAEIDRCRREYIGSPAEEEHKEVHEMTTKGERGGNLPLAPSGAGSQVQQGKQPPASEPGETWEGISSGSPESGKQPLRVKYPSTTPYIIGSPPSGGTGTGGSSESGGTEREERFLTEAEKVELEEAGRVLAARELESMDFSVEKMPQGNPGFDLRAKKDGDELRVEVKAHGGRATIVDVTHREYQEYLGQQGYRWELWNVEHLAENDISSVVITRYDTISDDALDVRTFRVDLKKCQRKLQD